MSRAPGSAGTGRPARRSAGAGAGLRSTLAACVLAAACAVLAACGQVETPPEASLPVLTMAFLELSPIPRDLGLVEAELNRRFAASNGCRVRLLAIGSAMWQQQVSFLLATGSPPDLLMVGGTAFINRVGRGQLLALDSLLGQLGPNIRAKLDPLYLKAGSVSGRLYGIPTIRDLASNYGVLLRADLLEKHGVDPAGIRGLSGLEQVLDRIHRAEPGLVPLVIETGGSSPLAFGYRYDSLGDDLGILPDLDGRLRLANLFDSPEYERIVRLMRGWYLRGLIQKDAATNQESLEDLLRSGQVFAALYHQKPGFAEQESRISARRLVAVSLTPAVATSDKVNNVMWGIPSGSAHPELAMRLLDRMYGDPELVNLLDWGIEGRHYVRMPDGTIDFPPGTDAADSGWNPNHGWEFGNQFLSHVFRGDDPALWEQTARYNRQAVKSPALGFSFDPEPVKSEYAAVNAVLADYRSGLECGSLDPDRILPLFRQSLHNAGIARVIAEKQRQLDSWALGQAGSRKTARNPSPNR